MVKGFFHDVRSDFYLKLTVAAAQTTAFGSLGEVPHGFCWYVERLTSKSSTTQASPVLEIYVLNTNLSSLPPDIQGRQDVATGSVVQNGVSDQRSPIYVPEGYFLIAVWSGHTAGDIVQLSAQVRVHKTTLDVPHKHGNGHSRRGYHEALGLLEPVIPGDTVAEV